MQNYYASRKWKRLPQSDCPAYSPVREAKTGISSVSPAYQGIKMGWLWTERPLHDYPGHPLRWGGGGEFQITGVHVLIHFSNSCKNDKWNSNLFVNNRQCKCEKRDSNPFLKVMRKRNKNRNSNPLFKVRRKRKTKNEIQIRFSVSQVDKKRKIEREWNSILQDRRKTKNKNEIWMPFFLCHRKTVGTKVHAFSGFNFLFSISSSQDSSY